MKYLYRLCRLIHIYAILMYYQLDDIIFSIPVLRAFTFITYLNIFRYIPKQTLPRGVRLRLALEHLGPIFVKAGQLISTRRDFLPDDIAEELAKLQDKVPPFSGHIAQVIIEKALEKKITDVFQQFDLTPLASASISQVHSVILQDGRSAVVKVLRPHIAKKINRDVDVLKWLASLANRFSSTGKTFKPREMVDEISQTLHDELDLMQEGANASQLKRNFQYSLKLHVPQIYWDYCRHNILVMERIDGIPITDITALKAAGINMKKLAESGIDLFFTAVFRDNFFHADMHPGNIFVSRLNLDNPQTILVDFGIVGSLSKNDLQYIAENMLAFFKRDYRKIAELHIASGWLPKNTRVDQFESAIRTVCEPIFEKSLKDISFGQLLLHLFQVASRFNMNLQPQLILLQKTLLNIEGLSRQIYPDLNLWTTATPFLEKWLKDQVGVKAFFRRMKDNIPFWSEILPEMPRLIYNALINHSNTERK